MPFLLIRDDIAKVHADAIVNPANRDLAEGRGTSRSVFLAAGEQELRAACKKAGHCDVGKAVITEGFRLPARYVIHAVGPVWEGGQQGEDGLLYSAYMESMKLARRWRLESLAFPLLSSGSYGYPRERALNIAVTAISDFLMENEMLIYLVVYDAKSLGVSQKLFTSIEEYIDEHYVREHDESFDDEQSMPWNGKSGESGMPESGKSSGPGMPGSGKSDERHPFRNRAAYTPMNMRLAEQEEMYEEEESDRSSRVPSLSPKSLFGRKKDKQAPKMPSVFRTKSSAEKDAPLSPPVTMSEAAFSPTVPGKPGKRNRQLEDLMLHMGETFSQMLLRLIDERGLTDPEVYHRANIDRKLFSKIRTNVGYSPNKKTVLSFAIALELSIDETKDLLGTAGYSLSNSSRFDVIISFFLEQGIYDIFEINEMLFYYEQPILG